MFDTKYWIYTICFIFSFIFSSQAQLTSSFTLSQSSGCSPVIVNFTNTSVGASSFLWDFGNSNSSTKLSPSTIYTTPGTYTVSLSVSNGSSTSTSTATVTVYENPTAKGVSNVTSGCMPLSVSFTDESILGSAKIIGWLWTFGDGSPASTNQNTVHTYLSSGSFPVALTITDLNGCQSTATLSNIQVSSSNLNPAFSVNPSIGCFAPSTFNFNNQTTGSGSLNYTWSFGDIPNQTVNSVNASHTYANSGNYIVSLSATNSSGCTQTISKTVSVLGNSVVNFGESTTQICQGNSIQFSDSTRPTPTSWFWDFGDGSPISTLQNPQHKYISNGNFNVKLKVIYDGICSDSVLKSNLIQVNALPSVSFSADTTNACSIPFIVNLKSTSSNASSYFWYLGDGSIANTSTVTHTYLSTGNDSVKLVVLSAQGCKDSLTKTKFISINLPHASFTTSPIKGCAPLLVNFTDKSSSSEPIISWNWEFGDTSSGKQDTSLLENPSHTYNSIGLYTVKLSITNSYGCIADTIVQSDINVTSKPKIGFTASPLAACAKTPITFTDTSKNVTSWNWNFGDGQSGSGSSIRHFYADTGSFTIQLIAYNVGCADTLTDSNYIYIKPAVPLFNMSNINCDSMLTRNFINKSLGASKWYWNFGDSHAIDSTSYNASHTYSAPGTYTVSLTVSNALSGCPNIDTTFRVRIIQLVPNFSVSPSNGCSPLNVNFINSSNGGNVYNYNWDLGDGNTISGKLPSDINPKYSYANPGLYSVKLLITDSFGCQDSLQQINLIHVFNIVPAFNIISETGCDSLKVLFRDTSTATPPLTSWNWTFGDGTTSSSKDPTHYFTSAGKNYSVQLNIANSDGTCSSAIKTINFTLPIASDTANTILSCPGAQINFTNKSSNANKYEWNFGDMSAINNSVNPMHSYGKDGKYSVELVAIDTIRGCSDTLLKSNYITIDKPLANFTYTSILTNPILCPPLSFLFVNTSNSISPLTNYSWNFGDGNSAPNGSDSASNTYLLPGSYSVELIVSNKAGCSDTSLKKNIIIVNGPSGSYNATPLIGCNPLNVNFALSLKNTKIVSLDFGDGNVYSDSVNSCCVSHIYQPNKFTTYTPALILTDAAGCKIDIPTVDSIKIVPVPHPSFSYSPMYAKANEPITFIDNTNVGTSWNWNFGDDNSDSTAQNPTHSYAKSGLYSVNEIVTNTIDNQECKASTNNEVLIVGPLIAPNVFTPNGDGENDTFDVSAFGVTEITIHVYNRWGLEVYYKVAEKISWDGHTTSGEEVPEGTYFYVIKANFITSTQPLELKGYLLLNR